MTKSEQNCKDMADVCELAHKRTIRSLRNYNLFHGTKHKLEIITDDGGRYGAQAQLIYNRHYDNIINITQL